jgi:DNA-binding GntR family transcriptional regulator
MTMRTSAQLSTLYDNERGILAPQIGPDAARAKLTGPRQPTAPAMPKNGPLKETPVRAHLLERLRSAITEGMFQPGDHLVERELCESLGVSRTSLREALRQIEAEGLIEFFPNRGAIVRDITVDEILELWELRTTVECLLARRFALHGTEEDITRLETSIAEMDAALKAQNRAAIKHAKLELWESFTAGGHHAAGAKLIMQINARLSFLWSSSLLLPGRPAESVAEFASLASAIRGRHPEVAEAAMILHNEHAKFVAMRGLAAFEAARKSGRERRRPSGAVLRSLPGGQATAAPAAAPAKVKAPAATAPAAKAKRKAAA